MIEVFCTDKDGNLVERLTQWDVDQYILIGGSGLAEAPNIHFCNVTSDEALVVQSELLGDFIKAKIPNILLQDKHLIIAYLYVYDSTVSSISAKTKATIKIPILPRPKPSNYPYVENIDYISATDLEAKIEKEIEDLNGELSESYNQTLSRIETSLEDEYKSTTNAIREEYDVYFDQMKDEHSSMVSDYEGIKVDYNLLSSDLREISSDLRETDSQLKELSANIRSDMNDLEESYSETTTNLENRYSETIDDLVSKFSDGSPKGYFSNAEDLSDKEAGIYINDTDGFVYYWDGNTISDAITRYEYTVDTDALNNHIANKNEPHVQRVSVGAMTTLSDIIDGTYTGFDGDEFITSNDIKKFYLTSVGGTYDGIELIVAGSYIDGGCVQVLNVYVSGNVTASPKICRQYYRTKQMGSWSDWKLVEHLDKELDAASTNAIQNKAVTNAINDVQADITSITGGTYTAKCHVGDVVPSGVNVTLQYVHFPTGGDATPAEGGSVYIDNSGNGIWDSNPTKFQGYTIVKLYHQQTQESCYSYAEDCYAVFEVEVDGEIPTLEEKVASLEDELVELKGGTTTVKCYIGDTVPFGDSVVLKSISVYGTEYTTDSDVDGNAGSQGIQLKKDGSYATANVTSEIQPENYGWSINQIHSYGDAGMATEYRDDTFAIFEVTVNGELNNNPVIGTYVGDGESERVVNIGFRPAMVEVYNEFGQSLMMNGEISYYYGGVAVYNSADSVCYDCVVKSINIQTGEETRHPIVSMSWNSSSTDNAFKVYYKKVHSIMTNQEGIRYFFKVYKNNQIMTIV